MLKRIKKIWQIKWVRVFLWEVFNGAIVAAGVFASSLTTTESIAVVAFLTPMLSRITKEINTKWFGDLGVVDANHNPVLNEEVESNV